MRGKVKSLNGYNPLIIKNRISNILGINEDDIKLFGSRITCVGWSDESELEVAITGEYCKDKHGTVLYEFGMRLNIHWIETFDVSYIKYAI